MKTYNINRLCERCGRGHIIEVRCLETIPGVIRRDNIVSFEVLPMVLRNGPQSKRGTCRGDISVAA